MKQGRTELTADQDHLVHQEPRGIVAAPAAPVLLASRERRETAEPTVCQASTDREASPVLLAKQGARETRVRRECQVLLERLESQGLLEKTEVLVKRAKQRSYHQWILSRRVDRKVTRDPRVQQVNPASKVLQEWTEHREPWERVAIQETKETKGFPAKLEQQA